MKNISNRMEETKELIISADDFGLNKEVNQGILLCFKKGIVTSASLLVNGGGFYNALEIIRNNPTLDVGLHLNVFSGRPLTNMKYVVDSKNNFLDNPVKFLFKYCIYKNKIKKEILEEFTRQIEVCLAHNVAISHLDTEKHLHVIPGIFESLLRLAEKYKIKYVRFPFEKIVTTCLKVDGSQLLKIKIANFFLRKNQVLLKNSCNIRTTDNFYGIALSGNFSFQNLKVLFEDLKLGVNELSCHPGMTDEGGTYIDKHRAEEFKVLINPRIKEYLLQNDIKLTSFIEN